MDLHVANLDVLASRVTIYAVQYAIRDDSRLSCTLHNPHVQDVKRIDASQYRNETR